MKIYVASSWRNQHQPEMIRLLRQWGHDPYDFRNPGRGKTGFTWKKTTDAEDPEAGVNQDQLFKMLQHPEAEAGFMLDYEAMTMADACLAVWPFGISASLELGQMVGSGKPGLIWFPEESIRPELMLKIVEVGKGGFFGSSQSELLRLKDTLKELNDCENRNSDIFGVALLRRLLTECSAAPWQFVDYSKLAPGDEKVRINIESGKNLMDSETIASMVVPPGMDNLEAICNANLLATSRNLLPGILDEIHRLRLIELWVRRLMYSSDAGLREESEDKLMDLVEK